MRLRLKYGIAMILAVSSLVLFGGISARPAASNPTFSKDVAPILYKHCVECHRPGEIAPMSLLTYEQVRPWARSIREKVLSGSMPPWHAVAPPGTFRNERRLSDAEHAAILDWVNEGAPEGDPKDLPSVPQFASGWSIGKPDAVVALPQEFDVPATGEISYKYFQAPTNFTEDKWVQAIEIRPGARAAVHHVLLYSRSQNASPRSAVFRSVNPSSTPQRGAAAAALINEALDRRTASNNRGDLIATTAPGTNAMVFPEGHAIRIPAGSTLTFQLHYTTNGKPMKDRTAVGFIFAKSPPQHEVISRAFVNATFMIPAGASNHRVDSAIEFVEDAQILAIFPHTHLRGKSWEYRMVYPGGRSEVVLSAPRYDFNWQTYYEFAKPLVAPKGARLEATAYYDNSSNNRSNPDPKSDVRWGDQTWEEMQYTGITLIVN